MALLNGAMTPTLQTLSLSLPDTKELTVKPPAFLSTTVVAVLITSALPSTARAEHPPAKVLFHLPFDGDLLARTPEREVEPSTGAIVVDDMDINVTIGELAQGPKALELGGGELFVKGDPRITYVPGLSGTAVRLQTTLTYKTPWIKEMPRGAITLWYRNPRWQVQTWRVPAMLTPAQSYRAKTSEWQTPISWWIFDRLTAPPEQGNSRWVHWFMKDFNEHPRNMLPRSVDDNTWHFWALRWDREAKLLEVIDDETVRDISKYETLLEPGKDYWEETYRGRVTKVYEDVGHIKFEEIFLGEIHVARYCQVTLDEIYVWDQALSREELFAACRRGRAGKEIWPVSARPKPIRRAAEALDLTSRPKERPDLPEQVDWHDEGALIRKTETQQSTCLNGYWRYQPCADERTPPRPDTWAYVRIPGDWGGSQRVLNREFSPFREKKWDGKERSSYQAHWFERDIHVPAPLKGSRFFFSWDRYDRDLTAVRLYINGHHVRRIRSYGPGRTDVTKWVRPGEPNRIALAVLGRTSLLLDLYFDTQRLSSVSVRDPYVMSDYRNRSVAVQFLIQNHTQARQTYRYAAEFSEWKSGRKAHVIPEREISVAPGQTLLTSVHGNWKNPHCWSVYDPFLYTAQVVIRDSQGKVADRGLPTRFGFREVWCEDGWLVMNGSKLHMRGMGHGGGSIKGVQADFVGSKLLAERSIIFHKRVNNNWNRNVRPAAMACIEAADELGFGLSLRLPSTGYTGQADWSPDPQSQLQAVALLRWVRNHPSVVSLIVRQDVPYDPERQPNGNLGMYLEQFESDPKWELASQAWARHVAPMRQAHPAALFHGMWRPYGDMAQYGSKPGYGEALQSREELPRFVAAEGRAKWNAECGWPQISRYAWDAAGQDGLSAKYKTCWDNMAQVTEELAAMYFGDEAYDQGMQLKNGMGPNWRTVGDGRFDWDYVNTIQAVGPPYSRKFPGPIASPGWNSLRMLFCRRNIAAWRWQGYGYWLHTEHNQTTQVDPRYAKLGDAQAARAISRKGVRMPGIYWDDGSLSRYYSVLDRDTFAEEMPRTELGDVVEKGQRPVVAWVFGWPDPMRKDHAYYEGETIRKQIAVMSEYPRPVEVTIRWIVEGVKDGHSIASGKETVSFGTGGQRLVPIAFEAPKVASKRRGRIRLETSVAGAVAHDDSFDIQIFPRPQPLPLGGRIAVIETPSTAHMLQTAGIPCSPVQEGTDLSRYDLLIIGRGCYLARMREMLKRLEIRKHLSRGLNLLIFEQEGEVLTRPDPDPWPPLSVETRRDRPELVSFGLRQDRRSARYAFIRDAEHPLFEGLSDEDFANWRGASNLIRPYRWEKWYQGPHSFRRFRRPNWSNLGDVATYVFEKPHGGNFVSLLDTQFDLLYSALLEERRADGGKTIYCQLNVTNRCGVDPVATLVVHRLVSYALQRGERLQAKAAFLGGKHWRKALENLPFELPDLARNSGEATLKELSVLVVGLGLPRIDEYDEAGLFIGLKATPAVEFRAKTDEDEVAELEEDEEKEKTDVPAALTPKKEPKYVPGKDEKTLAFQWLSKNRASLEEFVANGGTVLVLPVQNEKELAWLPFECKLQTTKVFAARPNDFFKTCRAVGPADFYWRRALEMPLPADLPPGGRATSPAVLARVPWKKGEFLFTQVQPKLFTQNWPESKIIRILSAMLTEKGVADRFDLDPTAVGYGEAGFPYFGSTLYFDPFLCTNW